MKFTTQWSIDPDHSSIEFKIRHLFISHISGAFKIFNGKMTTQTDNFETAEINLSIDVYSFDTNNIERDEHTHILTQRSEHWGLMKFPFVMAIATLYNSSPRYI